MAKSVVIQGAQVVTMDERLGDFAVADILIENGAIKAVGPSLQAPAGAERIDGAGMIALPGIIDAHTCLWQTVLRGYVPDLWTGAYYSKLLPLRQHYTAQDNYTAAYVGAWEMLSYGTTTVVDYCHNIRSPDFAPSSIAALKATGIRHLFEYSFMSMNYGEFPLAARYQDARKVYERFHDPKGLTTIGFGVDSIGAAELEEQLAFARSRKAPSCIHVNETGTIDKLAQRGLLGPDFLVIHGNLITNAELELMALARMPICFTPTADTQGTPADIVRRAMDRGVEVVFGCDIPCSIASDTLGQLRVMYNVEGFLDGAMERSFGSVIGRRPAVRPGLPLLKPRKLIEIATIGAARVLGLDDRIGSLTPGKRADIVLVAKGPFGDSIEDDACAHVLLQTSPREIDTVLVDGEARVKGGKLLGFDAVKAARMVRDSRQRILGFTST
jgi:cytosine/adenosine deaminase-related metal-dependent hydrolase